MKSPYNETEIKLFKKLNSPQKIQDYLNSLKFNFERRGETCFSPRFVIKNKTAHCMEGAMLAAAVLEFYGEPPLVLDLRSIKGDFDHVITVFKKYGCFGAISKTNHGILRYREPIYKTIRELALSYFHEYFLKNGKKTLREYSELLDLRYFDKHPVIPDRVHPRSRNPGSGSQTFLTALKNSGMTQRVDWRTSPENLFEIPAYLDDINHYKILSPKQIRNLRKADAIEIKAGEIVEYKK